MSGTPDRMATELERSAHRPKLLQMTFTIDENVLLERGMVAIHEALERARSAWEAEYRRLKKAGAPWQEEAANVFGEALANANRRRP